MPTASRKNYQNREVLDRDISPQIRGEKTGLLFLHYRLLAIFRFSPFSLSLLPSLRLCDEAEGQEPIILTKRREEEEEVLRRSPIHRLVEKTDKTVDRTDTAAAAEYEWTFGGCARWPQMASNSGSKVLRNLMGRIPPRHIYKRKEKKKEDMRGL